MDYFGGIVASYELGDAISEGHLATYSYYPRPAFLDPDLSTKYLQILQKTEEQEATKVDINLYRERRELLRKSGIYVAELELLLDELEANGERITQTIVFSPPGKVADDEKRILAKVKDVFSKRGYTCASITARTKDSRRDIVEKFADGAYDVLLGIGCLDEGLGHPLHKACDRAL